MRSLRVAHLHLTAASRAAAAHGAQAIADGFATASLPGLPGGAVVAVRRLDLGVIPERPGPTCLAHLIDSRIRALPGAAIHVEGLHADQAALVWAEDPLTAIAGLLRRRLAGQAANAWFWPILVPGWRPGALDPVREVAVLLAAASAPPLVWHGSAALVTMARRQGFLSPLLAALREDGLPPALALMTADSPRRPPVPGLPVDSEPALPVPRHPEPDTSEIPPWAQPWIQRWGPTAGRSRWLVACILVSRNPGLAHTVAAPVRRAQELLRAWAEMATPHPTIGIATSVTIPTPPPGSPPALFSPAGSPGCDLPQPASLPPTVAAQTANSVSLPTRELRRGRPIRSPAVKPPPAPVRPPAPGVLPSSSWSWTGQPSDHAGVVLLIGLLGQLGIDALLRDARLTTSGLPQAQMGAWMRRLRVPLTDPAWQIVGSSPLSPRGLTPDDLPGEFLPPAAWAGLVRRIQRRDQHDPPRTQLHDRSGHALAWWSGPDPLVPDWLAPGTSDGLPPRRARRTLLSLVAHRLLGRERLSLRRLVRRPGLILVGATHIDVTFSLRRAESGVRRLALDLTPGWVPWLGRVVTIHYVPEGIAP